MSRISGLSGRCRSTGRRRWRRKGAGTGFGQGIGFAGSGFPKVGLMEGSREWTFRETGASTNIIHCRGCNLGLSMGDIEGADGRRRGEGKG